MATTKKTRRRPQKMKLTSVLADTAVRLDLLATFGTDARAQAAHRVVLALLTACSKRGAARLAALATLEKPANALLNQEAKAPRRSRRLLAAILLEDTVMSAGRSSPRELAEELIVQINMEGVLRRLCPAIGRLPKRGARAYERAWSAAVTAVTAAVERARNNRKDAENTVKAVLRALGCDPSVATDLFKGRDRAVKRK